METAIWIWNYSFFCELCILQRKEDNQAVIFVICPHNWAFMEACYQLSLGLQVDFSMEWRLLQWHSLTRDKENADPDYYHIFYLAIVLLVIMMTMAFDKTNLANVANLKEILTNCPWSMTKYVKRSLKLHDTDYPNNIWIVKHTFPLSKVKHLGKGKRKVSENKKVCLIRKGGSYSQQARGICVWKHRSNVKLKGNKKQNTVSQSVFGWRER